MVTLFEDIRTGKCFVGEFDPDSARDHYLINGVLYKIINIIKFQCHVNVLIERVELDGIALDTIRAE